MVCKVVIFIFLSRCDVWEYVWECWVWGYEGMGVSIYEEVWQYYVCMRKYGSIMDV